MYMYTVRENIPVLRLSSGNDCPPLVSATLQFYVAFVLNLTSCFGLFSSNIDVCRIISSSMLPIRMFFSVLVSLKAFRFRDN